MSRLLEVKTNMSKFCSNNRITPLFETNPHEVTTNNSSKKAEVTKVDTMTGWQIKPKTWKSPRDLAYVPPPQTVKLSRFLNISIYSAVSWLLLFPVFFGGERGWGRLDEEDENAWKDSWDGSQWKNWRPTDFVILTDQIWTKKRLLSQTKHGMFRV